MKISWNFVSLEMWEPCNLSQWVDQMIVQILRQARSFNVLSVRCILSRNLVWVMSVLTVLRGNSLLNVLTINAYVVVASNVLFFRQLNIPFEDL